MVVTGTCEDLWIFSTLGASGAEAFGIETPLCFGNSPLERHQSWIPEQSGVS
jgi:hypothetical protein